MLILTRRGEERRMVEKPAGSEPLMEKRTACSNPTGSGRSRVAAFRRPAACTAAVGSGGDDLKTGDKRIGERSSTDELRGCERLQRVPAAACCG
jgi:hypothetical protein